MMHLSIDHLDLRQIAESGQCFRWKKVSDAHENEQQYNYDTYVIPPFGEAQRDFGPLSITRTQEGFDLSCDEIDWNGHWSDYLDMSTDYNDVERRIMSSGDSHLIKCYEMGSGIRILRQDLWEILITFLISQNNNITRITRSVEEICIRHEGYFPRPDEFDLDILKDRSIGLGYRVPYIEEAVKTFAEDKGLIDKLYQMSYKEAYETLVAMKGIGPKVANCICLFGLHHIEAFPIDTHVKQLLDKYYKKGFPHDKYEGISGIIQQYLFYYELKA